MIKYIYKGCHDIYSIAKGKSPFPNCHTQMYGRRFEPDENITVHIVEISLSDFRRILKFLLQNYQKRFFLLADSS